MTARQPTARIILAMILFVVATTAHAQKYGTWNPALVQSTVDAAALDESGRGFLEYSLFGHDIDWIASGGYALGGGVLRASFGRGYNRSQRIYGLGYARTLVQRDVTPFLSLGSGVDVSTAFYHDPMSWYSPHGARVLLPLFFRLGTPSWLSATPYVAPYGEFGRAMRTPRGCDGTQCSAPVVLTSGPTRAAGLAAGVQVTAWRLGVELGTRDLLSQKGFFTADQFTVGLRLHF
jgi:hypothetical protein